MMTTRNFSATDLPHPRYSLELARLIIRSKEEQNEARKHKQVTIRDNSTRTRAAGDDNVDDNDDDDVNLPSTCLPRFSQLAQVLEVKRPGLTLPGRGSSNIEDFLGSYCVIENARPELFVRRDFISKFVDKGTIHISHLSDQQGETMEPLAPTEAGIARQSTCGSIVAGAPGDCGAGGGIAGYKLATRNNVMTITMTAKQYHRFGLVAKKVISLAAAGPRKKSKRSAKGDDDLYLVEIDLRDGRIKRNNKYQDRLLATLRRLAPINKVYFRFIPAKSELGLPVDSLGKANESSLEFFKHVIREYALDGCQPVPLTACCIQGQSIERNWVNYSQLHPELKLSQLAPHLGPLIERQRNDDAACPDELEREKSERALEQVIDIADWLGYQLLQIDCDQLAPMFGWNADLAPGSKFDRVDVSCTRIIGNIDFKQVQDNLAILFDPNNNNSGDLLLRALILHDDKRQQLERLRQLGGVAATHLGCSSEGGATTGSNSNNSGVVYLQDLTSGLEAAQEITVIGMSKAG